MDNLIKLEILVPECDKEVHETAHAMLSQTMAAGQASNGVGSFYNKDGLKYHVWKSLHHLLRLWHEQDLEAREQEPPKLKHLYNAMTRLVLAEVVRIKNSKPEKQIFLEAEDE